MHFYGYAEPTVVGLRLDKNLKEPCYGKCGDLDVLMTDERQHERAAAVGRNEYQPNQVGCHGRSPVIEALPYTSYTNLWVLPIGHALLFGVIKDFLGLLLQKGKNGSERPWYSIPTWARHVMTSRATQITTTNDFGRPYRDVVLQRGNWTMEDYLHFTETFSPFIFQNNDADNVSDRKCVA